VIYLVVYSVCSYCARQEQYFKYLSDELKLHRNNKHLVQQIRCKLVILVTSVRLDQAATSPTFVYGVKCDDDIRRS
jgi:hypothetical protein